MGSILAFLVVVVSFFFGAELWAIAGAPIEPTNRNISDKSVVFIVYIVKCNKSVYTIIYNKLLYVAYLNAKLYKRTI